MPSIDIDFRWNVVVQALKPALRIAPPYGSWFEQEGLVSKRLRDLARIEIVLCDEHCVVVDPKRFTDDDLTRLSDHFTSLLAEALQLGKLAALVVSSGHSNWEIRSIADHPAPGEHPDR